MEDFRDTCAIAVLAALIARSKKNVHTEASREALCNSALAYAEHMDKLLEEFDEERDDDDDDE